MIIRYFKDRDTKTQILDCALDNQTTERNKDRNAVKERKSKIIHNENTIIVIHRLPPPYLALVLEFNANGVDPS